MYTITPIKTGTLQSPKDALTYRTDRDITVTFPVYTFLITPTDPTDDTRILVDTGLMPADADYLADRNRTVGPPGGGPEPLVDALAASGHTPDDIDHVILTHLHHDHASNIDLFPHAEFLVQTSELDAATDPYPVMARSYPQANLDDLTTTNHTVLKGDFRLRKGIDIILTPGHTRGMQSIIVETTSGPHALVGDLAYIEHNLDPSITAFTDADNISHTITPREGDYLPPGTHISVTDCYESYHRIMDVIGSDGTIIPSHDPRLTSTPLPNTTQTDP